MNNDINNLQNTSAFSTQDVSQIESTDQQADQKTGGGREKDDISKSGTAKGHRDFSTPSLEPPEFKEAGGGGPTQTQANAPNQQTAELEANAFNTLEEMVLEQLLDQSISETSAKQLAQQAVQQTLTQHLNTQGPVSDANFAQAMASMGEQILRSMSGKKPTDELAQTVNRLKAKATAETNPEFNVLVELLKNQNLKKKMPPKQAEDEAIKNALDMSKGDEFNDEGLIGTKAQTGKAIADALTAQLGNDEFSHGVALGISKSLDIANSALSFIQGANNVNPTPEVDKINRAKAEKVLKGVLTSLSEIVEETKNAINATSKGSVVVGGPEPTGNYGIVAGIPGAGVNQSSLAMLTYVASIIAQFQQILGSLIVSDNANASEISQEQVQQINAQSQEQLAQLQEQEKTMNSPWQKILNIVLTVVTTLVSVLAAPFTMGTSLLEMAAVLSIIAATSIATSVLSSTGVLQKAFTGLTTDITNALAKSGHPKWVQNLVVALVMVAIIVAAAVVARGAAGSISSALISTAVKQATVQFVCMMVSTSGVFTDLANTVCTAVGADAKATEIADIVTNVVGSIAMAGFAMKATTAMMEELSETIANSATEDVSDDKAATLDKIKQFSGSMKTFQQGAQAGNALLQAGGSSYAGWKTISQANAEYQVQDMGAQIQVITALIALLQQALQDMMGQSGSQGLMSLQVSLYNLFSGMVQSQQQAMGNLGGALKP